MSDETESVLSDENPRQIYNNLRVELFDGTPEDAATIGGLSSDTTVRSFRALVAARFGTSLEHIRLMAFGNFLDDSTTLGQSGIDEDTPITRIQTPESKVGATRLRQEAIAQDPTRLREKYSGRRLNNVFVVDATHRTHTLRDIPNQMTVGDFVRYAASQMGHDAGSVRLHFGGKELRDDVTHPIIDYGVQENSTLQQIWRLPGGDSEGF